MSGFIVHSVPGSPFGRAVLATLEEKRAPYRFSEVAPQALQSPEHLARHPFGRVPVLEHDGFWLYETQAILRYLDRTLGAGSLTPEGPRAAARMDLVMNVNDWYFFQSVGRTIAFQRIVAPKVLGMATDESAVAAALPAAIRVLDELSRLLGNSPYFAGSSISLADLLLAPQVDLIAGTPEWAVLGLPRDNVVNWLERMNARASMQATTWDRVTALAAAA